MWIGRTWVSTQSNMMNLAIIKSKMSEVPRERLIQIYPVDYFDVTIIGIKEDIAKLFENAGICSVSELAKRDPKKLYDRLAKDFQQELKKYGISETQIAYCIEKLRELLNKMKK